MMNKMNEDQWGTAMYDHVHISCMCDVKKKCDKHKCGGKRGEGRVERRTDVDVPFMN